MYPFFYLSIVLTLSIILTHIFNFSIYCYITLAMILIVIFLLSKLILDRETYKELLVYSIIFILGIFISQTSDLSRLDKFIDQDVIVGLKVIQVNKFQEKFSSYECNLVKIYKDDRSIDIRENVIFNYYGSERFEEKDLLKVKVKLKEAEENTNPALFNYKLYLKSNNIKKVISAREGDLRFVKKAKKIRFKPNKIFSLLKSRHRNILKAFLTGNTNFIDLDDLEKFRNLGLAHLLAISGLHIGIIVGFFILLFGFIGLNFNISGRIIVLIIFLYGYFLNFPISLVRAGVMISIWIYSIIYCKYYNSLNTLAFVYFILIIFNPNIIFNLSFQLSFLASLAVLILPKKLNQYYFKLNSSLAKSIVVIFSVQLSLFPLQSYYFNQVNPLGFLANLLIIPIISLILPLVLIYLLIQFIWEGFLSYSILVIIDKLLSLMFFLVDFLYNIDWFSFTIKSPSLEFFIIYYLLILFILKVIRIDIFPLNINKFCLYFFIFVFILNLFYFEPYLKIDFIDVGQGDCALIKTLSKNYLIDTGGTIFGNFDVGKNIVIPYLKKTGVKKLHAIFISHFDADHCKSTVDILKEFKVEKIYIGHRPKDNSLYKEILSESKKRQIPLKVLNAGDQILIDKNINFRILSPSNTILQKASKENDRSQVILIEAFGEKILFTGDIEELAENNLLATKLLEKAKFIKVPHHGSKTSSSKGFLEKVKPSYAFLSVGRNNSYGHPDKSVLQSYRSIGSKIYRTDRDGLVSLDLRKSKFFISRYLPKKILFSEYVYLRIWIFFIDVLVLLLNITLYKNTYKRRDIYDI